MSRSRNISDWLSGHPLFGRTMGSNREQPRLKVKGGGKVRIGGHAQRMDGTRYTRPAMGTRRKARRAANARAKVARRANRR